MQSVAVRAMTIILAGVAGFIFLLRQQSVAVRCACYSASQCVAVRRSASQCVVVCCSAFRAGVAVSVFLIRRQSVVVHCVCCSVLQCVAVCFNALQCVAVCCRVSQFLSCVCVSFARVAVFVFLVRRQLRFAC